MTAEEVEKEIEKTEKEFGDMEAAKGESDKEVRIIVSWYRCRINET